MPLLQFRPELCHGIDYHIYLPAELIFRLPQQPGHSVKVGDLPPMTVPYSYAVIQ